MRIIKTVFTAALLAVCTLSANAQECNGECQTLGYRPYPYGFVQLQGGLGTTLTDVSFTKLLSPTASIGAGAWFNSAVGARLHVNAWESKGGIELAAGPLTKYKYNYFNTNADLMLNLTNFFSKNKYHTFNVVFVGGFGLNYAWDNSEFLAIQLPASETSVAWGEGTKREHLISHNLRAGLLFDLNLAKHWAVGLEIDANSLSDAFNSKYTNADDWMITAQLGLTYKFGHKAPHAKPAPEPVKAVVPAQPVVTQRAEPVRQPEPVPQPEPVKVVEEPFHAVLHYAIREANVNRETIVSQAAEWAKKYPSKTLTVSGYADKGTGNAKLNQMYSEQRAAKVVDLLKQKGVPASQIQSKAYGDTVQPFSQNDENRCVIIDGK